MKKAIAIGLLASALVSAKPVPHKKHNKARGVVVWLYVAACAFVGYEAASFNSHERNLPVAVCHPCQSRGR